MMRLRRPLCAFCWLSFYFSSPVCFPFRVYHTPRTGSFIARPVSRNIASTLRPSNSIWVSSVHYKYIWVSGFIWAFYYLLIIHKLWGWCGRYYAVSSEMNLFWLFFSLFVWCVRGALARCGLYKFVWVWISALLFLREKTLSGRYDIGKINTPKHTAWKPSSIQWYLVYFMCTYCIDVIFSRAV